MTTELVIARKSARRPRTDDLDMHWSPPFDVGGKTVRIATMVNKTEPPAEYIPVRSMRSRYTHKKVQARVIRVSTQPWIVISGEYIPLADPDIIIRIFRTSTWVVLRERAK